MDNSLDNADKAEKEDSGGASDKVILNRGEEAELVQATAEESKLSELVSNNAKGGSETITENLDSTLDTTTVIDELFGFCRHGNEKLPALQLSSPDNKEKDNLLRSLMDENLEKFSITSNQEMKSCTKTTTRSDNTSSAENNEEECEDRNVGTSTIKDSKPNSSEESEKTQVKKFIARTICSENVKTSNEGSASPTSKFFAKRSASCSRNQEQNWRSPTNATRFFGERNNKLTANGETNWRNKDQPNKFFTQRSTTDLDGTENNPSNTQVREMPIHKQSKPEKPVTFNITNLLEKTPTNLITYITENLTSFDHFLVTPLPSNTTAQLVFVIEKVCTVGTKTMLATVILKRIYKNVMNQLNLFFVKLSLDEENEKAETEEYWKNPETFWISVILVLKNFFDRLQLSTKDLLPKIIKAGLVALNFHKNFHNVHFENDIDDALTELLHCVKNLRVRDAEDQLYDFYLTTSAYPDSEELLTHAKPFLRRNLIEGSYQNTDHYLDTHFRLLREDFLAPLREAIATYKRSLANKEHVKITEFRIYENVNFEERGTDNLAYFFHHIKRKPGWYKGKGTDLYFLGKEIRKQMNKVLYFGASNTRYTSDATFMNGNLVCLSDDNFKTMFFGIITKLHETRGDYIDLQLLQNIPFMYERLFTMLECTNYFGTYCLTLKALQNFDGKNFPMEAYIINVQPQTKPPVYLTPSTKYTIEEHEFTVLDFETWPSQEELNLNKMQYEAFRHALTSEFSLIQGPPGTGKTHVGLKIVETLIQNPSWSRTIDESEDCRYSYLYFDDDYDEYSDDDFDTLNRLRRFRHLRSRSTSAPILVVAYTNHALDQFLEGLMPYTQNIIRLGQQSKNDAVSKFVYQGGKLHFAILEKYYASLTDSLIKNRKLVAQLDLVSSFKGIYHPRMFSHIPLADIGIVRYMRNSDVLQWLMGNLTDEERKERWEMEQEITNASTPNDNRKTYQNTSSYIGEYCIVSVASLMRISHKLEKELQFRDAVELETMFLDWHELERYYQENRDDLAYIQWRLQNKEAHTRLFSKKPIPFNDPYKLSHNDRWILYFRWLDLYVQYLEDALQANNSTINSIWDQMEQHRQQEDGELLSSAVVVGMTTSGAARYQTLLQHLQCRVVVVEEAAEVLESHIIISLTKHCQHLILIGDHQQLRPSTANYQIEKQFQLGISLFERMVRNGMPYSSLQVQHRMRPEICELIVPAIYPGLENHESVSTFPNIGGTPHNVFFINHKYPEVEAGNSRKNTHEAKYVIALAKHLLLQGYKPSEITILTTYKGQMYEIENCRKTNASLDVQSVQVTVVDNFQGEENEIILLSLVRSNNENSIGFLAIENRVCVALSRAKKGFYMIGNLNILTQNSKIWPKIRNALDKHNRVGSGLKLQCQLHPENAIVAVKAEDFDKVPDGGCSLPCDANLECGHVCCRKCHVTDLDHQKYRCKQPCTKILCDLNHVCPKMCWQECGPCKVPMERTLPCEHIQMVPCSVKEEDFECLTLIETSLKCGHSVVKPCFANVDEFKCPTKVEVTKPLCGHPLTKLCHEDIQEILCKTRVNVKLRCGHTIDSSCYEQDGYGIKICSERCNRELDCGHKCTRRCHYLKDPSHSTKEFACVDICNRLRSGCKNNHKCELLCSKRCMLCVEEIRLELPCGHIKMVECFQSNEKYKCDKNCNKIKPCGHICYSKCHAECDLACFFKVPKAFPTCGHRIKINCSGNLEGKVCFRCNRSNARSAKKKY